MRPGAAALTFARRPATLLLALILLLTALVIPNVPAGAAPDETFADDFQSYSFGGSTGSQPWTGPWVESGESDGVGAGTIRVDDEPNCLAEPCLLLGRDPGPDASVERELDLSSFESATLTFDYKVHWHPPGGGSAELRVSDDGGGSWVPLDSWPLGTSTADLVGSYDLTPYRAPNTRIMFSVTGNSNDSHMNVDNLAITATPEVCYLVGSNAGGHQITSLDLSDPDPLSAEETIGVTGADIRAIALDPTTGTLYGATADQLHTIDTASGAVTTIGPFGSSGPTVFNNVSTLTFDPGTGVLYASHYRPGEEDLIFQVDPATGSFSPNAFGPGLDYVVFVSDKAGHDSLLGLAIDPAGQMWGMSSNGASQEKLHTIDKNTGAGSDVLGSSLVGGLSFDRAGTLWGIDPAGVIFEVQSQNNDRDIDNLTTYADVACPMAFTPPPPDPGVVVVSEVSHRNDDFIELYNIGPSPVDIEGYVVRLDGIGTSHITLTQGGGSIMVPVGGHYLLAQAGSGLAGTADQVFGFGLPDDFGIRLRDDVGQLLDEVGIGTSPWFEGSAMPSMPESALQSYQRRNGASYGNCIDTDNNVVDFVHNWGHANPQNLADPVVGCGAASPTDHVVISEFRPEGPAGALDEFVELFNPTSVAVDVSGWIVHITEPGLFRDYHVVPGATILDPGEHYLLSNVDGPVPADAQPYDIATNYAAAWGDVVLKDNVGAIVDVLGFGDTGNGQLYEGTALPAYAGGTDDRSFARRNGGYTDTDNNTHDFVYAFVATPERGIPGPNRAPVFDQDLLDRSDVEGELITISSPATDPDWGDTLTYSATDLPEGISIDPTSGDIKGALGPNSSGVHSVTITVTDDGTPSLDATDLFSWTIAGGDVTYLVANTGGGNGGDDLLTVVDRVDANPATNEVNIGTGTGTSNIEAAALQPGTHVLFAVENDRLGTIDLTTGVFAPKPAIAGAGNGPVGLVAFNNIEGLSFNPYTGELFGTHRRGTGQGDLLFRFDPATGAHIPGAFGGDDYVVIQVQYPYHHAADIAFDPTDGQLYLIHWDIALNWTIATLDPVTGATTTRGPTPDDIVSLAFDETGRLYASTETGGAETLYELDKADGSVVGSIEIDNGSNYEAMAIAFPVDPNQPPVFNQNLLDRTDAEGSLISLSAAATDSDAGQNLIYTANGLPPGLAIDPGSGLITGTISFAASGAYPVEIVVTDDGIPNLDASDAFTWTVTEANQPPTFDQDLPDRIDAEGSVISLAATATDPDGGDILSYGATGLPPGLSIDTGSGVITGTIGYTAAAGSPYAVTITAADNGSPIESAAPDTFSWTVSNTNQPPTIVSPGAQTTPELAPFSITISASDPDGEIPSFNDGATLPAWAVLTDNLDGTATIAGTPGAGDSGTTTVTITASDGGVPDLSDDAVFDITVTNVNLPPGIVNPGNQLGAEASPFNLVISATDADGTTVSFTDGSTLPAWATLTDNGDNTATITGTPGYSDAAVTTVTITASDGSLTDDAVFDITISDTNRAPLVDPINDQTAAEGTALVPVLVTATDPDGTIPSLSASGLPVWASFVDNADGTGTVTGTPGFADAGVTTVTITASDGTLPDSTTFDLTVTNVNRPPTVNAVPDQSVAEGVALVPIVISSTDPDGTFPSIAATGLPGWVTFVDNLDGTATITGTPGYSDAAVTAVTINVEDDGTPNLADSTTFDLTVTDTNRAPIFDQDLLDRSDPEGTPFSISSAAADPDLDALSYAATGLPPGLSIDPDSGLIAGTVSYGAAGTHAVQITVTDNGSPSLNAVDTFTWAITDTERPPVANPIADQLVAENDPFSLVVTAWDPDGTIVAITDSGTLPGWATLTDNGDNTATITGTPGFSDEGTTAVTITVSDGSLSDDATFDITVTNTNRPPVANPVADQSVAENDPFTLTVTASDPDGTVPSLGVSGLPGWATFADHGDGTGTITGNPGFTDSGTSTVTITASDGTLTANATFDLAVTNTNAPPVADPIPDQIIAEGDPFVLTVTASDLDGTIPFLTAAGLPAWATFVDNGDGTGTIAGTPGFGDAATSTVTVTASDGSLTDDAQFKLRVVDTNEPPVFDNDLPNRTDPEGTIISLPATATDPNPDTLLYAAVGLPPGITIDPWTGLITGTIAYDAAGTHAVTITVTDDGLPNLEATDTFTWTVTNMNRPPILGLIGDQLGVEETIISFTATATDPDLDGVTFSLAGEPTGAAIDATSGVFSWTPGEVHGIGSYAVTVSVADDGEPSLSDSQVVTITVAEANRAPSIEPISDQVSAEGSSVTLPVTATDPDLPANTLTYSATGLPAGLSINKTTGVISGTIGMDAAGTHSVTVAVTDNAVSPLLATTRFTWTVTNANQPPILAPIDAQSVAEHVLLSFSVAATDADDLTFSLTGAPTGASIHPVSGLFTWTPDETQGPGTYSTTVVATDAGSPRLAASEVVTITVTESNQSPILAAPVDQVSDDGDPISLQVTATDSDVPANTLTYAAAGLPPGLSIDAQTGLISGTIALDETYPGVPYAVEITATDNGRPAMSATATFAWLVNEVIPPDENGAPVISPIGDQFSYEGDTVALLVVATDAGPITYSAAGLPPGLTINPASGFVTGVTGSDAIGSHPVTITVSDTGTPAMSSTAMFRWTITDVAAAETKDEILVALESFEKIETEEADTAQSQPIRRSLVVMGSAAAATTEALRWPIGLLLALLVGFATMGRIGLYPLLWRGDRHTGTISYFEQELNFGLIEPDGNGEAVFVHAHAFPRRQRPTLETGAQVRYRVLASDNRASAWGATIESGL